jgi:serine/threonine protein kinase
MGIIDVHDGLATPLSTGLQFGTRIEYRDESLGAGGFGEVYRLLRFDGCPPALPLVLKILRPDRSGTHRRCLETTRELQRRLAAKNEEMLRRSRRSLLDSFPALIAAPQFSFTGARNGQEVLGYCACDLAAAGMESFSTVLSEPDKRARLQDTPLPAKIAMAAQLVEVFDFLNTEIRYIHADLKADNLFVNLRRPACAIIDLDSGALARDPNDTPTTLGTLQEWLAPEIARQIREGGRGTPKVRVNLLSDIWSVTVAVHYLLFGFHPFFFLSELSERSMSDYFARFRWPQGGAQCQFFRSDYAGYHRSYLNFLQSEIPREIAHRFEVTFNKGYANPTLRATYRQWRATLDAVRRQPPEIVQFRADRTVVNDDRPLRLVWSVRGAQQVEIRPKVGKVTGRSHVDVVPLNDTMFELIATSPFGAASKATLAVRVEKTPPRVLVFRASPALARPDEEVELQWEVTGARRVRIEPALGEVPLKGSRRVRLTRRIEFQLLAESPTGVVSRAICKVQVLTPAALAKPTSLAVAASALTSTSGLPASAAVPRRAGQPAVHRKPFDSKP